MRDLASGFRSAPRLRYSLPVFALVVLALSCGGPAQAQEDAESVLSCVRGNIPKTLQIKEVEMTAVDRGGGERELRGRVYVTRNDEQFMATVKLSAPPDLNGASYLLREHGKGEQTYMYLPALQRVRRITGAQLNSKLWGTDITYGDIKQLNNAFSAGATELAGHEDLNGRPSWQLVLTPAANDEATADDPGEEQAVQFSSIHVWIDAQTCVSMRADFLDGSTVAKRYAVPPDALRQADKIWYAAQATVSDLVEETHTVIKVVGVSSGEDLSGRLFNPMTFYIGG